MSTFLIFSGFIVMLSGIASYLIFKDKMNTDFNYAEIYSWVSIAFAAFGILLMGYSETDSIRGATCGHLLT